MSTLRFGYGTNGLTDVRLPDALRLLADLGYDGVGLTLDHMHLDPLAEDLPARTARVGGLLAELNLSVAVETGARYVLDPRAKHGPSLLDPDPERRALRTGLLVTAVRVAAELGAHAVHCFSGVLPSGQDEGAAWDRLLGALAPVLDAADTAGVPLAIEPEPGHLVGDLAGFHLPARPPRRPGAARSHARHRPLPVPRTQAARRLRRRGRALAAARTDRGHAQGRPRAPALRGRRDRLPARARRARSHRLPGPHRRRTAPPLPRRTPPRRALPAVPARGGPPRRGRRERRRRRGSRPSHPRRCPRM
ncbi:LOW QUALITY PROTEIN: sugar phosphate isomerase/epimerase, partial [Streptomyces sp. SPB78]